MLMPQGCSDNVQMGGRGWLDGWMVGWFVGWVMSNQPTIQLLTLIREIGDKDSTARRVLDRDGAVMLFDDGAGGE